MKQRLRALLGLLLCSYVMPALALYDGFYTGLDVGYSVSCYNAHNVKVDFPQMGLTDVPLDLALSQFDTTGLYGMIDSSANPSTDNSDLGGRLYLGYKFYKLFSAEIGYTRYADSIIDNVFFVSPDQYNPVPQFPTTAEQNIIVGANTRVEQQSIDISGKVFVPILDLFQVWGQLGMAYLDTNMPKRANLTMKTQSDGISTLTNIKIVRDHERNFELMYGFGGGYSFDDRFSIDIAYQVVQPRGKKIRASSLLGLNATMSFG